MFLFVNLVENTLIPELEHVFVFESSEQLFFKIKLDCWNVQCHLYGNFSQLWTSFCV